MTTPPSNWGESPILCQTRSSITWCWSYEPRCICHKHIFCVKLGCPTPILIATIHMRIYCVVSYYPRRPCLSKMSFESRSMDQFPILFMTWSIWDHLVVEPNLLLIILLRDHLFYNMPFLFTSASKPSRLPLVNIYISSFCQYIQQQLYIYIPLEYEGLCRECCNIKKRFSGTSLIWKYPNIIEYPGSPKESVKIF